MVMRIEIEKGRQAFEPGEELAGRASWALESPPGSVELRLFWFTEGKGTQDVEVVETAGLGGSQEGRQNFRFRLPAGPYSFSGQLLSIRWALELVAESSGETERLDLVIGPGGQEVEVHAGS